MIRKTFKVMTKNDIVGLEFAKITEVLGYFKNIETESIFVYYNDKDKLWYVIDPLCGLSITSGYTKKSAIEEFTKPFILNAYREFKKNEKYLNAIKKYNELLKKQKEIK